MAVERVVVEKVSVEVGRSDRNCAEEKAMEGEEMTAIEVVKVKVREPLVEEDFRVRLDSVAGKETLLRPGAVIVDHLMA